MKLLIVLSLFFGAVYADDCPGCNKCLKGCNCGCTSSGVCSCKPEKKSPLCNCGCAETGVCTCVPGTCPEPLTTQENSTK